MKTKIMVLFFLFMCPGLAGIAHSDQYDQTSQIDPSFAAANEWLAKNNLALTGGTPGYRNDAAAFSQDAILFYGEAYGNPSHITPAQRAGMAKRAAVVVAQRSLAEYLSGFSLVGDSLVRDGMAQYDQIRSSVTGFIRGTEVVINEYSPEKDTAIAIIKIGLHGPDGFASTLYRSMFPDNRRMDPDFVKAIREADGKPAPAFNARPVTLDERYDGLVIDATDQNFRPALINRIFTVKGDLIYDPSKVSRKVLVEQGCGDYTNSVDKAKAALAARGVRNPLIVKAVGTLSASDLQVSDDDAVRIYSANRKKDFFAAAKVAFVLK